MSSGLWFRLKQLPDISLPKYRVTGMNPRTAALEALDQWFEQTHTLAVSFSLRVHLFFLKHSEPESKFDVLLGFTDCEVKSVAAPIKQTLDASALSDFFTWELIEIREFKKLWSALSVSRVARLCKKQTGAKNSLDNSPSNLSVFPIVGTWKAASSCSLAHLSLLMSALDGDSAFQVSWEPLGSVESDLRRGIENLREYIRNLKGTANTRASRPALRSLSYDESTSEADRFYGKLDDAFTRERFAKASILFYSTSEQLTSLLAGSAAAEALVDSPWQLVEKTFRPGESGPTCLNDTDEDLIPAISFEDEDYSKIGEREKSYRERLSGLTTLFSGDELRNFVRIPLLHEHQFLPLLKESEPGRMEGDLLLGRHANNARSSEVVHLPLSFLTKHALICGVPGSGKTNTVMHLAMQARRMADVPFLIVEPAKREYRALCRAKLPGGLMVFTPGRFHTESDIDPLSIQLNPFEFPKGVGLVEHIVQLRQIFEFALGLWRPLPTLLEEAIGRAYMDLGWDIRQSNSGDLRYPKLEDVYHHMKRAIDELDYHGEFKSNLKSAFHVRFKPLINRELGEIFNVRRSLLEPSDWLRKSVLLETESLGRENGSLLALLVMNLIRQTLAIGAHTLSASDSTSLRHLLILEEAHNLIGRSGEISEDPLQRSSSSAGTQMIVKLLAEMRALGQGIVIADQIPSALAPEVLKNTNVRICHRLTAVDDRQILGASMGASDLQVDSLARIQPGEALFAFEGSPKPISMQVNDVGKDIDRITPTPSDGELASALSKADSAWNKWRNKTEDLAADIERFTRKTKGSAQQSKNKHADELRIEVFCARLRDIALDVQEQSDELKTWSKQIQAEMSRISQSLTCLLPEESPKSSKQSRKKRKKR